jgi:hypothetical protein
MADDNDSSDMTIVRAGESDKKQAETLEQIRIGERWIIGIGVASVIMNIVIAFIYYGELKEMRKATVAAVAAAGAAKKAAEVADSTFKNQQQSFQIDQRPYVVAETPIFSGNGFAADKPITANITLRNIGRTPARRIANTVILKRFDPLRKGQAGGTEKFVRFIDAEFASLRTRNGQSRQTIEKFKTGTDIAPGGNIFTTNDNLLIIPTREFPKTQTGAISVFTWDW